MKNWMNVIWILRELLCDLHAVVWSVENLLSSFARLMCNIKTQLTKQDEADFGWQLVNAIANKNEEILNASNYMITWF